MYLSRLQLNPASRTLWKEIVDQPYRQHQLIMRAFPDGVNRQQANVLHRLDQTHDGLTLIVQSDLPPAWAAIDATLLQAKDPFDPLPNPAVRQLDDLQETLGLQNGRYLQFRLRANPTKRKSSGKGNKPGPRIQLVHEAAQLEWLQRKARAHGFVLIDAEITPEGKQTDFRKKLTVYTMLVNGVLQITDAATFTDAVRKGIGPAKAFGCGLLSLAPA